MVKEGRGTLRQDFKIRLDIEILIDYIAENITKEISAYLDDVDIGDVDIDGNEIEISGTYSSKFKSYWCSATLESPEEYDIDREYIGDITLNCLPEEMRKLITVSAIEEDEEGVRYPEDDYEDDRAYDEWKDRQLEGDY